MKTNLFLLGMAVAAFSSCTNEEVTDVAQNRAIKFNQFVENNTREVQEVESLSSFYVFGKFGEISNSYTTQIFNNESQDTPYYWVANKFYIFGAYADGNNGKIEDVTFDSAKKQLVFTNYSPDDTKDLVAAISDEVESGDNPTTNDNKVSLTFHHMLSQVKFTFNTTDAESYTLNITNLTLHAAKTGTGTYSTSGATWRTSNYTPSINDNENKYIYDEVVDVSDTSYEAQSKLVIPQNKTHELKVTFTATITGAGLMNKTANFEATLAVGENIAGTSDANTWMPGYRYNYTATINGDDIDPDLKEQKIKFTPSVTPWEDATSDQPVNPTQPAVP